jgi:CheY-like chemotaxis protein
MKNVIRILYLEDAPADAARLDHELSKSGMSFRSRRVDSREDFLRELEQPPDVILSDHGLPAFDGLEALSVAREKCPEVPFIFVTNSLTPEMEIEKLVGKVADYVLKSQLDYLPFAVNRALRVADENKLRKQLLDELRAQSDFATRKKLMLPICSSCKKIRDEHTQDSWKLTVTSGRANDWRNRGCNILDRLSNSKSAALKKLSSKEVSLNHFDGSQSAECRICIAFLLPRCSVQ